LLFRHNWQFVLLELYWNSSLNFSRKKQSKFLLALVYHICWFIPHVEKRRMNEKRKRMCYRHVADMPSNIRTLSLLFASVRILSFLLAWCLCTLCIFCFFFFMKVFDCFFSIHSCPRSYQRESNIGTAKRTKQKENWYPITTALRERQRARPYIEMIRWWWRTI
jgi:hypothetical protein